MNPPHPPASLGAHGGRWLAAAALTVVLGLAPASAGAPPNAEGRFMADNRAAMDRMMTGMTIKPSGEVDRDFVDMMVPHHQGAVDMALAELRYGHDERLRRLAQEIVVTQREEIVAMRRAAGEASPAMQAGMDMRAGR
jgi:uncharacterized protein (DUF305 family)